MFYKFISVISLLLVTATAPYNYTEPNRISAENAKADFELKAESLYHSLDANHFELPKLASFESALKGFYQLKEEGKLKSDILTLVDFSLSSSTKRLWVIDLAHNTILINSLVAHGKNSGDDFATRFSNVADSFKSSLGFFVTGEVYKGKHGLSLKLDGQERGRNDNARSRYVVVHGADYVSEDFVRNHHRCGRSQGCPAVPVNLAGEIINTIKDKTCLYIYHPSLDSLTDRLVS
jgi:hypothetical protein